MTYNYNILFKHVLIGLFLMILALPSIAQDDEEKEMQRTRSDFIFHRLANGTKHLSAKVFTKDGPNFYYLDQVDIQFLLRTDTNEISLGTVKTGADGIANFFIEKDYPLDTNANGAYTFAFSFEGNDTCTAVDEELEIRDLNIEYEFTDDGEGYKSVSITLTNSDGSPAAEQEVYVYVKRLYSMLPLGDDWSDDDGWLEVEIPGDLPGDSLGNLDIVIRVSESDDYGTVDVKQRMPWGIAVDYSKQPEVRALWAQQTPLWMVIAIAIVLIGAWSQFVIAIYHLFKMKKSA